MATLREFLSEPIVQAVVSVSVLAILIAAGWYVVSAVRRQAKGIVSDEDDDANALWLDEYRSAYESGQLTRKEFDRIKAKLRQAMLERVEGPPGESPEEPKPPTDLAAYLAERQEAAGADGTAPADAAPTKGAVAEWVDPTRPPEAPFGPDGRP